MFRKVFLFCALVLTMASGSAMAAQKISVASDCTWPPMEFLDENKQPIGFSVDLLREMGKELGVEFDIQNVPWDGIFSGVAAGKYQMVSSSTTITEERLKKYLFSDPYYDVVQSVVMPLGKNIASLADLKDKKVGGQIGTTGIFVMEKSKAGATIREYDDVGLAMKDLANGRLDAVICDSNVATYYANVKAEYKDHFHVAFKTKDVEHLGFCLNKDDTKMQKLLNDGLAKMRANGRMQALIKKWMGE